jgi:DNA-directed RNA polymerase subunit N (RpoN/RPB10)
MIIPIRCFTCNKVIGHLWKEYNKYIKNGEECGKALDNLGLSRYCCRRMLLSHTDVIDDLLKYANNPGEKIPNMRILEEDDSS